MQPQVIVSQTYIYKKFEHLYEIGINKRQLNLPVLTFDSTYMYDNFIIF